LNLGSCEEIVKSEHKFGIDFIIFVRFASKTDFSRWAGPVRRSAAQGCAGRLLAAASSCLPDRSRAGFVLPQAQIRQVTSRNVFGLKTILPQEPGSVVRQTAVGKRHMRSAFENVDLCRFIYPAQPRRAGGTSTTPPTINTLLALESITNSLMPGHLWACSSLPLVC